MKETKVILTEAKKTSRMVALKSEEERNSALLSMADALEENFEYILKKNNSDVERATEKLGPVMIDRLRLSKERIFDMAKGLREVARLPDPLKKVFLNNLRPNGLNIKKVAVPMGVIAIIYESRPNVTSDAASLALKSGNACILRSGKDAFDSAMAITEVLRSGLEKVSFPVDAIQLIEDKSHDSANELMKAQGFVDLLIPRGGKNLIKACVENATVPCIHTGTGICHIYIDKDANADMALSILNNAKTSRPSVCNAAEVCLVHRDIAGSILPKIKALLVDDRINKKLTPVEIRGDEITEKIIDCNRASAEDFDTEFLDYILAVKVVQDIDEAIEHISLHSTGHSEAIISKNQDACEKFARMIDSSSVYINASTRFTDGGEFGLGCEMGISTQKLHARGPMGLEELTTYKYIISGEGQTR